MKQQGSRLIKIFVSSVLIALSVQTVSGAILINFDAGPPTTLPEGQGLPAIQTGQAVLGFTPNDVWNSIDRAVTADGNSYYNLVDSNNNALAGLTFDRTGTHYDGSGPGTNPDLDPATANLMGDFMWTYNTNSSLNPVIWTLTGLSAYAGSAFTLVIYAAGDLSGAGSTLTLADSNGGDSASTSGTAQRISDGPGVAYVELSGIVDAAGQVQFNQTSPNFTAFNGAQILIVPEPATWVMLIAGTGILNFWQRFRRLRM